jgi:hypothetical protein
MTRLDQSQMLVGIQPPLGESYFERTLSTISRKRGSAA